MNIFDKLEKKRKTRGSLALTLIDPDVKNQEKIIEMVKISENSDIDAILVGGSLMMDEKFDLRLKNLGSENDPPDNESKDGFKKIRAQTKAATGFPGNA